MAEYTNVTREQIEELLLPQGFKAVRLDGVSELVYAKRVDLDGFTLSLRVFTGINPNGASREVGTDAIRCNIFWRRPDGEVRKVATSKRVHRVAGWRKNLQDRIDGLRVARACSKCGSPMVTRKSRNGEFFFGCGNYPTCTHTERS